MKYLAFAFAIVLGLPALAATDWYSLPKNTECRVNRMVDYTYFEEGLSANEYPDIDVAQTPGGEWAVMYGAHQWQSSDGGYSVSVHREGDKTVVLSIHDRFKDEVRLEIEARRTMARATVKVKESGDAKYRTIAYALCNTGFLGK